MQTTTTYNSDAEQLVALRVPFPVDQVKEREENGKIFDYYEHNLIQNRLLDVFGGKFSMTTGATSVDTENNFVHVEVILEVEWISGGKTRHSGWGSAAIQKKGNHFKSAYSDALKVAATKLGCGLELYDDNYRESIKPQKAEIQRKRDERALLTCQGCGGVIAEGTRTKPDGTIQELTAKQVATSTRQKFGKRFCLSCGIEASKTATPSAASRKPLEAKDSINY